MTRYLINRYEKLTRRASKGSSTCCARPPMTTAYHKHANQWLIREPSSLPRRPCLCILPCSKYQRHIIAHQHRVSRIRHTEIMEKRGETTVDFSLVAMPPCDPPGAIRFLAADRNNSPTRKRDRNHQPKNIGRWKCHDFVKKRLFIIHYLPLQARLVT